MHAQPSKRPLACCKEAERIKGKVDTLLSKMLKEPKYTPTRNELEDHAELIIDLLNARHAEIKPHEIHLKSAIIDLTEVPEMSPTMQRIAFQTALKDASAQLERFLHCY